MTRFSKVHLHSEQFDGWLHAECGAGDVAPPNAWLVDDLSAVPYERRCRRCARYEWPSGGESRVDLIVLNKRLFPDPVPPPIFSKGQVVTDRDNLAFLYRVEACHRDGSYTVLAYCALDRGDADHPRRIGSRYRLTVGDLMAFPQAQSEPYRKRSSRGAIAKAEKGAA